MNQNRPVQTAGALTESSSIQLASEAEQKQADTPYCKCQKECCQTAMTTWFNEAKLSGKQEDIVLFALKI